MADNNNSKNKTESDVDMTVSIELDDGTTMECAVLQIYSAGGKEYIAISPMEDLNVPEARVWIYGYSKGKDGMPELINIEDDEEFDMAIDAFDEYLDEMEYYDYVPADMDDESPLS